MTFPPTISERLTAVEARLLRQDDVNTLHRDGLSLLSEDLRATRSELGEFRREVAERFDSVELRAGELERRMSAIEQRMSSLEQRVGGVERGLAANTAVLTAIARQLGVDVPPAD